MRAGRLRSGQWEGGSDERPQKDDLLVVTDGPQSGQVIKPSDLKQGGPPVHAWPKDPKTSVVRSGLMDARLSTTPRSSPNCDRKSASVTITRSSASSAPAVRI